MQARPNQTPTGGGIIAAQVHDEETLKSSDEQTDQDTSRTKTVRRGNISVIIEKKLIFFDQFLNLYPIPDAVISLMRLKYIRVTVVCC